MATYLSLDEAAKKLGIPTEVLIDLRSQGQVRGFRDGSSWKFPDSEIARLKEELPNLSGFGSGILAADGPGSKPGSVIGGDLDSSLDVGDMILDDDASGISNSSVELGMELPKSAGDSDVNLVPGDGSGGSDVLVIPGGSGGSSIGGGSSGGPIDLDALDIAGSALSHDSGELNLGSGPVAPARTAGDANDDSDEFNLGSVLDIDGDDDVLELQIEPAADPSGKMGPSGKSSAPKPGAESLQGDSDIDLGLVRNDENASNLELLDDLDLSDSASSIGRAGHVSGDVLSEMDLLTGGSVGSDLLSGDSENLLGSSLLSAGEGGSSGVDDALADDDDLIISDDDDDLIISGAGSDISIAGDSGINLMSPSDSGLSLESEPLDLAGSSISALDLGAELSDGGGSGSGSGGSSGFGSGLIPDVGVGSDLDFPADEEFQLSPSGISLDKSEDSESQEIDVENSDSFASGGFEEGVEEVAVFEEGGFGDAGFADDGGGFAAQGVAATDSFDEPYDAVDEEQQTMGAPVGVPSAYEVPFTLLQTVSLLLILMVMSLGGMLMTDLVRNMWTYTEPAAPVSSFTDMLIDIAGWGR